MDGRPTDAAFAGSIPQLYESLMVPLIFEPYAIDLVERLATRPAARALEIAAGTGVVTRRMASVLPDSVSIVATAAIADRFGQGPVDGRIQAHVVAVPR